MSNFIYDEDGNVFRSCSKCNLTKPVNKFGRGLRCFDCIDIDKADKLFIYYGITEKQYQTMLIAQNEKCKICLRTEVTRSRQGEITRLCVDHDHKCCPGRKSCGKCVRGLLCQSCNRMLGHIEKDKNLTNRMLNYISCESGQFLSPS